jgi:AraC-like DNA-binding protein
MVSLIRSRPLKGYSELVVELGGDPKKLLKRFHISQNLHLREDTFLPFTSLNDLYEASAKELSCPDFGLRLAPRQGLEILGAIAIVARNSDSIGSAYQAIAQYLHLHSPSLRLHLDAAPDETLWLNFEILDLNPSQVTQNIENSLGIGLQVLRFLAGPDACPLSVSFSHQQIADARVYKDYFRCKVLFEQNNNGMLLPMTMLTQKIMSADPEIKRIAQKYLDLGGVSTASTLHEGIAHLIRRLLSTGHCRIEVVAEHLSMHKRTLQRQLAKEDIQFEKLVDHERRELARRYLTESSLPLTQIAGHLGYAEQSAFNRSCRRWFSSTPRVIRENSLKIVKSIE